MKAVVLEKSKGPNSIKIPGPADQVRLLMQLKGLNQSAALSELGLRYAKMPPSFRRAMNRDSQARTTRLLQESPVISDLCRKPSGDLSVTGKRKVSAKDQGARVQQIQPLNLTGHILRSVPEIMQYLETGNRFAVFIQRSGSSEVKRSDGKVGLLESDDLIVRDSSSSKVLAMVGLGQLSALSLLKLD